MNTTQAQLYRRIASFTIDEPGVRLPFTVRLARENGWDLEYARRVGEEYKKFMFLAVAAGHPVAPSEQVDQAWHLHLVYTRSYWEDFCGDVLGRSVHHGPSKGGREEHKKYRDWYERTKASYRRLFGGEPPEDIWPDVEQRFGEDLHCRRVNTKQNWIVPKRPLAWLLAGAALLLAGLAAVSGCVSTGGGIGPRASSPVVGAGITDLLDPLGVLDLAGPQFLVFFAVAFAVALCVAAAMRWYMRRSDDDLLAEPVQLEPYEVAYLAGGEALATSAAVASLVSRDELQVDSRKRHLSRRKAELPKPVHPLEEAVFHAVDPALGSSIRELHRDWSPLIDMAERLTSLGLVVSRQRDWLARVLSVLVALSVPLLGAMKIYVGISRDKPVGFLVVACIIAAIVAFAAFGRRRLRTSAGDRALERMKTDNVALEAQAKGRGGELAGPHLVLALGLFGLAVLEGGALAELHTALKAHIDLGGGGGCGAGGGCGGGGGGGGGGGCGGCGGCGG